jgi:hypothetical protein
MGPFVSMIVVLILNAYQVPPPVVRDAEVAQLGARRATFGERNDWGQHGNDEEWMTVYKPVIEGERTQMLFPAGSSDFKYYLNERPFLGRYLVLQVRSASGIEVSWKARIRGRPKPTESELRHMGTLEAMLARKSQFVDDERPEVQIHIKAKRGLGFYRFEFMTMVIDYHFVSRDGTIMDAQIGDLSPSPPGLGHPITSEPYPVTDAEIAEIRALRSLR